MGGGREHRGEAENTGRKRRAQGGRRAWGSEEHREWGGWRAQGEAKTQGGAESTGRAGEHGGEEHMGEAEITGGRRRAQGGQQRAWEEVESTGGR